MRRKERLTYRYELFAIELTKVDLFNTLVRGEPANDRPNSTTFEVEIELRELAFLRSEAAKVKQGQPNDFVRIAGALLDTMRTLAQYALPSQLPVGWKPIVTQTPTNANSTPTTATTGASQGKKRTREEENASNTEDEFGKRWS